jgi:hypothetical protein
MSYQPPRALNGVGVVPGWCLGGVWDGGLFLLAGVAHAGNYQAFFELVASSPVLVTCHFEIPIAGEADPAKREIHLYKDFCDLLQWFLRPS